MNNDEKTTDEAIHKAHQRLAEDLKLFDPLIHTRFNWSDVPRTCNRLNIDVALIEVDLDVVCASEYEHVVVVFERQNHEL